MFKPDATLDDWVSANATIQERIAAVKAIAEKSRYQGPYLDLFTHAAVDIYDVLEKMKAPLQDGFQFRDLEDFFVIAAPALYNFSQTIHEFGEDRNREAIFRDLVVFIYYELEKHLKLPGFAKFILRFAIRIWGAKNLAKYIIIAFDYVDGKVEVVSDKAEKFVANLL